MLRRLLTSSRRRFSSHAHEHHGGEQKVGPPCFNSEKLDETTFWAVALNVQLLAFFVIGHYKPETKNVDFEKEAEERLLRRQEGKEVHFGNLYYAERVEREKKAKIEADHEELVSRWKQHRPM
ncbi:hypothetical protein BASA81_005822 [Batrachochytrium salamandrivorans]|nr:hypothetical protein BASA81_005822 [Batrachochytrium salamandrivorans]